MGSFHSASISFGEKRNENASVIFSGTIDILLHGAPSLQSAAYQKLNSRGERLSAKTSSRGGRKPSKINGAVANSPYHCQVGGVDSGKLLGEVGIASPKHLARSKPNSSLYLQHLDVLEVA